MFIMDFNCAREVRIGLMKTERTDKCVLGLGRSAVRKAENLTLILYLFTSKLSFVVSASFLSVSVS
jgi:hypothetical protein